MFRDPKDCSCLESSIIFPLWGMFATRETGTRGHTQRATPPPRWRSFSKHIMPSNEVSEWIESIELIKFYRFTILCIVIYSSVEFCEFLEYFISRKNMYPPLSSLCYFSNLLNSSN